METRQQTCCVFGHRTIQGKEELKIRLNDIFEYLIVNENVDTFLLGSKSEFDDLCREVLALKKQHYPHIQRIYVRAEYPHISEKYEKYLLQSCEKTYFPDRVKNAGKAIYVERNCEMIDKSDICIVYFDKEYFPPKRKRSHRDLFFYQPKSGTNVAYQYAVSKKKKIFNLGS